MRIIIPTAVLAPLAQLRNALPGRHRPRYVGRVSIEDFAATASDPYVRELVARVVAKQAAER